MKKHKGVVDKVTDELIPFDFEGAKVRTLMQDGMPWFNADDVCKALGYLNTPQTIADHVDEEDRNTISKRYGNRGNPNKTYINESGLYALIFGSGKPKAKRFKRWVTSEVLPTIRKTGSYQHLPTLQTYSVEATYPMAGPYQLSPAFFVRLYYALDKMGSDASLVFHLLRLGGLDKWIVMSFRDLSESMDYAVSYSTVNERSRVLSEQGVLDVVISRGTMTRYKVNQETLDSFIARVPELADMRPGLESTGYGGLVSLQ